jgi:glycosyltransferase involved in cell wall biosynthesis
MLISVCIPTYNGAKYIHECITSVLNQSFADFEIIFCDDCSTDNTVEIIRAYQLKDSRIKLFINEKNKGLVGNWNQCMKVAKGEWIKFIFQDDIMAPNCLEVFLSVITSDTRMIICERKFLFEADITPHIKMLYDKLTRPVSFQP